MGSADWSILTVNGGDPLTEAGVLHSSVPVVLPRPIGDTHCRQFSNIGGSAHGNVYYRYIREAWADCDLSIRAAMCLAVRNSAPGNHSIGMGLRMSSVLTPGSGNSGGLFATEGYFLVLTTNVSEYNYSIVRLKAGESPTILWTKSVVGVDGVYKWFHLRMDITLMTTDSLLLRVFENDLTVNSVDAPVWVLQSGCKYGDPVDWPALRTYNGVGVGAQCYYQAGFDSYLDWVEILHRAK